MAYSRLHKLILIACASIATLAWSGLLAAGDAIASVFRWHEFEPDPATGLQLDRMGHVAQAEPQGLRRYLSFRMRALLHALFDGDGFSNPQAVGSA